MAVRTVTGTLLNIKGEPHAGAKVRFLLAPFGLEQGGAAYPRQEQVAITDSTGAFEIDLWVSDDSSKEAIYTCVLPSGERFRFILPDGVDPIDIEELFSEYSPVEGSQQPPYIKEILSRTEEILSRVPLLNPDGNLEAIVIHRSGTFAEINDIVLEEGEIAVVIETGEIAEFRVGDGVTSGGLVYNPSGLPLVTDSYIIAIPGDDLAAKYNEAKALTPNGSALSDTNRATLYIMKGSYSLSGTWNIDTNYVDVIGIGVTDKTPSVLVDDEINVTAWNVRINGVETPNKFGVTARPDITSGVTGTASNNRIQVTGDGFKDGDVISFTSLNGGTGLSNNVRYIVAITSGASSTNFRLRNETTGALITFSSDVISANIIIEYNSVQSLTNCTGGANSFGFVGSASGTFTNCTGGANSFGGSGTASGTFTNCTGGDYSLGGFGTASGTFTNCVGGNYSFGAGGNASGAFTNCTGGANSFGGIGTASGTFNNCTGGASSFGGDGIASGTFTNCTGTYGSFGGLGTASGTFTHCTGGEDSFGGDGGTISGKLYYCRLTTGSFQTPTGSGLIRLSIDGSDNVVNSDPA